MKYSSNPEKTEETPALFLQFLTKAPAHPYSFLHFFTLFYTIPMFFSKNMYAHPPVYVPLRMLQAEYLKKLLKGDFSIRHRISFNAPYDVPSVE